MREPSAGGGRPSPGSLDPALLREIAGSSREGVCWSHRSDDLDLNLVAWSPAHGVEPHVNTACDVLVVGLSGEGEVRIDRQVERLLPGRTLVVPMGAMRSIRAETRLLYLTCHRRQRVTFEPNEVVRASRDPR